MVYIAWMLLYVLVGLLITIPLSQSGIEEGDTPAETGAVGLVFTFGWPIFLGTVVLWRIVEGFGNLLLRQRERKSK